MTCLDHYRSKLLASANQNLRVISAGPDETAIHRFRVAVKRLTALYRFLGAIKPEIRAKQLLRPARRLSKSISTVRDCHITLNLFSDLDTITSSDLNSLRQALETKIARDYSSFADYTATLANCSVRLPTLRALGFSEAEILRNKPVIAAQLRDQISPPEELPEDQDWHRKRILLKRYHHSLDAFRDCRGHAADEKEIMQMKMLEQLLGDWHDRVIAAEILQSFTTLKTASAAAIVEINRQEQLLLGSARLYLARFSRVRSGRQGDCAGLHQLAKSR